MKSDIGMYDDIVRVLSIYRKHNNYSKRRSANSRDATHLYCLYYNTKNRLQCKPITTIQSLILRSRKVKRVSMACKKCGAKFIAYVKRKQDVDNFICESCLLQPRKWHQKNNA